MIRGIDPGPLAPRDLRLRDATRQMEGVFLQQLLKAMRETVPEGGLISPSSGEEMFTALFDERIAQSAADRQDRGLGAVLFRQLRAALNASGDADGQP